MNALQPPDTHHLNAAEGWLGLGNLVEAEHELASVSAAVQSHPEVLRVRYHLYERSKSGTALLKPLNCSAGSSLKPPLAGFTWRMLCTNSGAPGKLINVLIPVVDRFPEEYVIRYNLACYSCQMGELEEARAWLKKSIAIIGADTIKEMASTDPDLRNIWPEIHGI